MVNRKLIRERIKEWLVNGNTVAGSNVFENKSNTTPETSLPFISIATESEDVSIKTVAPRQYTRIVRVEIELVAKKRLDLDDALDDFTMEVERILHTDHTLGGLVVNVVYTGTRMDYRGEEGQSRIGSAIMSYEVEYASFHGVMYDDDYLRDNITLNIGDDNTKNISSTIEREES